MVVLQAACKKNNCLSILAPFGVTATLERDFKAGQGVSGDRNIPFLFCT
jgi:hypothetical protein